LLLSSDFGDELIYAICVATLADQAVFQTNEALEYKPKLFMGYRDIVSLLPH
jgi:hypothetical protein